MKNNGNINMILMDIQIEFYMNVTNVVVAVDINRKRGKLC